MSNICINKGKGSRREEEQYDDDATGGKTMVQRCTEHITLS